MKTEKTIQEQWKEFVMEVRGKCTPENEEKVRKYMAEQCRRIKALSLLMGENAFLTVLGKEEFPITKKDLAKLGVIL